MVGPLISQLWEDTGEPRTFIVHPLKRQAPVIHRSLRLQTTLPSKGLVGVVEAKSVSGRTNLNQQIACAPTHHHSADEKQVRDLSP